jgi:hypothetical protein
MSITGSRSAVAGKDVRENMQCLRRKEHRPRECRGHPNVAGDETDIAARWRSRLATLSIEGFDSFVASTAASIASRWNEPVPGRELHPLKSSAFHGTLFHQLKNIAVADESKPIYAVGSKRHLPALRREHFTRAADAD